MKTFTLHRFFVALLFVLPCIARAQVPELPKLPPGVELPPEVQAEFNKAIGELKKLEGATKVVQPPKKTPAPTVPVAPVAKPKTPAPQTVAPAPVAPSAPAATTFKRVAKEQPLAKVGDLNFTKRDPKKPHFWVSPDGRRLAYLIDKGIAVDDKRYQYPNSIRQADQFVKNFHFSPDSRRTSWIVHRGNTQGEGQGETLVLDGTPEKIGWNFIANHDGGVFSRDSQHVAYTARRYAKGDVEYTLMIDGAEREVFPKSPAWALTFTPDNKRVLWAEETADGYQMRETSVDGAEPRVERKYGPAQLTMNFRSGPAGETAFVAKRRNEQLVVFDGRELTPAAKEIKELTLSGDGKQVAFVTEPQSFRSVVVIDGKSSPVYGGLEADYVDHSLTLSPVGGRSAYAIKKSRMEYPLIDGKQGKGYARVAEFIFSANGKRVAHQAAQNGKFHIVADGRESAPYDEVGAPVFSPDANSIAYAAGLGPQKFVVHNGQRQKAYTEVGEPEFSPDGKRLVYLAELTANGPTVLVDSGKEGKQYEVIQNVLYFSPTGQRLAMVASEQDKELVVVDGVEGNRYDLIITIGGGKVTFEDENRWRYLAVKDGEVILVEETIE